MSRLNFAMGKLILLLFEAAVGIVLLVNPIGFATVFITVVGVLLAAVGLMFILQYFRSEPLEAQKSQGLLKGGSALLVGLFCALNTQWFINAFPFLTVIHGIVILFTGIIRVQWTVDMLRLKLKRWYIAAGGAVVSIVLAVIIFINPFGVTEAIWMFIGISFLVDAVADLAILIFSGRREKEPDKREIVLAEENTADEANE
ncbi:MAG: DUF308 domain-containing protein [Oscillospiraceae bacterium]|nr:DUF308 domain-containing protein [Oscillospiraceae bacterium]